MKAGSPRYGRVKLDPISGTPLSVSANFESIEKLAKCRKCGRYCWTLSKEGMASKTGKKVWSICSIVKMHERGECETPPPPHSTCDAVRQLEQPQQPLAATT